MDDFEKAQLIESAIMNFKNAIVNYCINETAENHDKILIKQNELYEAIGSFMEEFKFTVR